MIYNEKLKIKKDNGYTAHAIKSNTGLLCNIKKGAVFSTAPSTIIVLFNF